MTKTRRPRAEWEQLCTLYRSESLTQKSFCEMHELSLSTFQYWLRETSHVEQSGTFIPLGSPTPSSAITITHPSGITITIR